MAHAETHTTGVFSPDFLLQIALGNVDGYEMEFIIGEQDDLDTADGNITLWDNKFDYTPFTADTEMFLSSTNVDDNMTIRVAGLDANFDRHYVDLALTGQTQVSLGNFRHVQAAIVLGANTPAGDVYIAAADTLTLGVPDTNSAVKSKIIQGLNVTHNAFFMVPRGKTGVNPAIRASTDSPTKYVKMQTEITQFGGVPISLVTYTVLSGFPQFIFPAPLATSNSFGELEPVIPEKTFVQYKAFASTPATQVFFGVDLVLVDQQLTHLT